MFEACVHDVVIASGSVAGLSDVLWQIWTFVVCLCIAFLEDSAILWRALSMVVGYVGIHNCATGSVWLMR